VFRGGGGGTYILRAALGRRSGPAEAPGEGRGLGARC